MNTDYTGPFGIRVICVLLLLCCMQIIISRAVTIGEKYSPVPSGFVSIGTAILKYLGFFE